MEVVAASALSPEERVWLRKFLSEQILPVLTPQASSRYSFATDVPDD